MTMCMLHPSAFKCPHSKRPNWGFVKCHQKGGKKSKENQKLNLTSNISEIGNPQKLTWPSFSWYFCHSIWEVPHGSGSFSPSCWSKAAMSWWHLLSLGHAHSGSQDSPNNTSHPNKIDILPKISRTRISMDCFHHKSEPWRHLSLDTRKIPHESRWNLLPSLQANFDPKF